jgi:transketolase
MTENSQEKLERLATNTIRMLAVDAIEKAKSGHPGMPMGMADCAFVLFHRFLRHDPQKPDWPGRDRFILSAGHGSMLLYSLLHLYGYELTLDDLKNFRQWGSPTPGHPERGCAPGVETTTGPLGQGFGNSVGLALAGKLLGARLNTADFRPVDWRVFTIASDGDLMEGVAAEAASLAGHLKLSNLTVLYDDNRVSIEGPTDLTFSEDVGKRFDAYGWHIQHVDGHDRKQVESALQRAVLENTRPSIICARTHIAYGSPNNQESADSHGAPLGREEVKATKESLRWPQEPGFEVPDDVRALFARRAEGLKEERLDWEEKFKKWCKAHPDRAALFDRLFGMEIPGGLLEELVKFAGDDQAAPTGVGTAKGAATRALSGKVLQRAAEILPGLVGGSADLAPSNKTMIKDSPSIRADDFEARNLHFGVREHAMAAMLNGMALSGGLIPYGGTFLVFSDYMRPSIRLAAMMGLSVIYVFTHDSIFVGEDGPTHQPVEHLSALRAIPNLLVYRPADALETAVGWALALQRRDGPTALVLTRQKVAPLERPDGFKPEEALAGAYVLCKEKKKRRKAVVATGSELSPALAAARELGIRAISMPSVELFLSLPKKERQKILPDNFSVAVVEASRDAGWHRLADKKGLVIGMDRFGASAPASELGRRFGFTEEAILEKLRDWVEG